MLVDGSLEITESPVVAEYVIRKYGSSTGRALLLCSGSGKVHAQRRAIYGLGKRSSECAVHLLGVCKTI